MSPTTTSPAAPWRQRPLSMAAATVLGAGHLPGAPGTWGALAAMPIVVALSHVDLIWRLLPFAGLLALSILSAHRAGQALGEHDSRHIVIDEAIGVWTALLWWDAIGWVMAVTGFAFFRIIDIVKDPLSRRIEHRWKNGWGVVADDLTAGVFAALLLAALTWLLSAF